MNVSDVELSSNSCSSGIQVWDVSRGNFIWNQKCLGNLPAEKQSSVDCCSSGLEDENKYLWRILDALYRDQTWSYVFLCITYTVWKLDFWYHMTNHYSIDDGFVTTANDVSGWLGM